MKPERHHPQEKQNPPRVSSEGEVNAFRQPHFHDGEERADASVTLKQPNGIACFSLSPGERAGVRASLPHIFFRTAFCCLAAFLSAGRLFANPDGLTVVSGSASAQTSGSQLNVTASHGAFLDWRSFNIQAGETTRFLQPDGSSVVFNRIGDAGPSQIWGSLLANGTVVLANAHGFYFGPDSMVKVGGSFVATTAPLTPDFGAGAAWQFSGLPPLASIVNYGSVEVGAGRSLFLIAEKTENHGTLSAPGGGVWLTAGQEVLVSERPDGRGLSATITLPSGSVDNSGRILADGGSISLRAQVVNQNGIVQANSVREHNGVIELVASDAVNLRANSLIQANGGSEGVSAGGSVTVKSGGTFADAVGSRIESCGGTSGGNGGFTKISAAALADIHSQVNSSAQAGFAGGSVLIDPTDLALNSSSLSPFSGQSAITFQADRNITFAASTVWNLSAAIGVTDGQLSLLAGNNITFGNGARIMDANNWAVNLHATAGSIFLNGGSGLNQNGAIETSGGAISLLAGDSVRVGSGFVRTAGGGAINVQALSGDVDAGKNNAGYVYDINGYRVNLIEGDPYKKLGGISTAAGGSVTIEAGRDILSVPTVPNGQPPGASGAYGSGDVTLTAGRNIRGNFLVRNGTGSLTAQNIGLSESETVSLSLVSGSWSAHADNNIFLNEVRNPNGTFNRNSRPVPGGHYSGNLSDAGTSVTPPANSAFLFDYAPNAAVNLWAGNGITLAGGARESLPRVTGQNLNMPPIYPPELTLSAGAGGISVLRSIVLFASSQGQLDMTTREGTGGNLSSPFRQDGLYGITMSDSGQPGWATFEKGRALIPVHLLDANPSPVTLDISGSIGRFNLTVPTFADITVRGTQPYIPEEDLLKPVADQHRYFGTYNFGFLGQNLSPSAVTTIKVLGDITYRGNLTTVAMPDLWPAALLDTTLSPRPEILLKLRYDAATGALTFVGQMTEAERDFLKNPTALVFDEFGQPRTENGQFVTTPIPLTDAQRAAVDALFADSKSASLGDNGLAVSGQGLFKVIAQSADLGISGGISVLTPNAVLAGISPFGANLEVNISGDLVMTSTKIANESYLGGINLTVGGNLDVGGQFSTFGDAKSAKGILTAGGGDVSVTAHGDVNVNGSRIATYNGGNINVVSETSDVNAGNGGSGVVNVSAPELDPVTGKLITLSAPIPLSGILATTVRDSTSAHVGNITVSAPNGSINASLGGVIQLALNDVKSPAAFIDLNAGRDINAGRSGIIGENIQLNAAGNISGVVVGSRNVNIQSQQSVDVTAVGGGNVTVSAQGTIAGSITSGGTVSASGDSISAALVSKMSAPLAIQARPPWVSVSQTSPSPMPRPQTTAQPP